MATIQIAVIREYDKLSKEEIKQVVAALQKQLDNDFYPVWGINAKLTFYEDKNSPEDAWQLVILDNTDQAGDFGYHDLTKNGFPIGKVFAGTDARYGTKWSVTASHELLEMLCDPEISLSVWRESDNGHGKLYAYEVCDACEDDVFGYDIDGVTVSDFLYPTWFQDFWPDGTQFDYKNYIKKPFQILQGCYTPVYNAVSGIGWAQEKNSDAAVSIHMRGNVGSRRERRRTPRTQWLRSTIRQS